MTRYGVLTILALLAAGDKIFDGKTLDGWEVLGGGKWTVEGGAIKGVCAAKDEQGVLIYKRPVKDFTATLEFRISGGNSGFYFRTEKVPGQPLVKGFQAEVAAMQDVGGIWETAGRGWVSKPTPEVYAATKFVPGQWTRMDISAIGSRYVVKVNGKVTADVDDPAGRKEGWIALQLHGGMDMTVEFRNLDVTRKD